MRRIRLQSDYDKFNRCGMCGQLIFLDDKRHWQSNNGDEEIGGICFMSNHGDPVEAFDLCDECIGKLYSKMIY